MAIVFLSGALSSWGCFKDVCRLVLGWPKFIRHCFAVIMDNSPGRWAVLVILAGSPRAGELGLYSGGQGRHCLPGNTAFANLVLQPRKRLLLNRLKNWNLALLILYKNFQRSLWSNSFQLRGMQLDWTVLRAPYCHYTASSFQRIDSDVDYFFKLLI